MGPHVNVQQMLVNLQEVSAQFSVKEQYINEMAADYLSGGILAYMKVGTDVVKYMLTMYKKAGSNCHKSHLSIDQRREIIQMGHDAHIIK